LKPIAGLALLVLLAVAGALVYAGTGGYDVAAVDPEPGWIDRALATVADRSVARHAAGIQAPPLADPAMVRRGAALYGELCAVCHGGPGVKPSPIGMGLNPGPPDLVDSAREMPAHQIYWIVHHGIARTGMPAFGPGRGERDLWAVVAFVEALPRLSPEAYQEEVRGEGAAGGSPGPPPRPPAGPIG
jgi:mono/diheme cytochrome c family protein